MSISTSLKQFVESKKAEGITATFIAGQLNISKKTLSNYINGDAYIPLNHLNNLSNIYDVSIDYILGLNSNPIYSNYNKITTLNRKVFGDNLKEFRKQNKITQNEIAQIIGVNKSNISRYENGINEVLTISLYSICKNYHLSADYLLGKISYLP